MADIVDSKTRSRMMSGITGKNTKPEVLIRKHLHSRGFRFRLHRKDLPGKPDIVLPKYRAVILVNGCFWHGHGCALFKWPGTRKEFWEEKINANVSRDRRNINALRDMGWRVFVVWECCIRGPDSLSVGQAADRIERWLKEGGEFSECP
ncbi:very short patch repair endonuclease [Marinobacter sp.]|uniref:very short patch repair endonuclease n=1 Tax=Marinobacter sp. TaxID=50741 RepID=UPI003850F899